MIIKYNNGIISERHIMDNYDKELYNLPKEFFLSYCNLMNSYEFSNAIIGV